MKKEQKITILVAVLTAFITSFTGSALNLAIPDISSYFAAGASTSGWIVTGYTVTVALLSIPAGRMADTKGRKTVLITGSVIFTAASAASALSLSIMMLIISRAVQGIGAAMIFSTNTAILAGAFSEDQRGRVLGYALAATYTGLSAGPFLGGVINNNLGWRMIFAVTGAVTLAALVLAIKLPPSRKSAARSPFKLNAPFVCSSLAALLNYGATFVVSYLLSIYLQTVMGYSSQTAGMILLVQPIIISILSPVAGKKSDSVSPFRLAAIGMAVCGAGVGAGLLLPGAGKALWPVILILAVVGIGSALFSSPNTNATMSCVEKKDYSFASSVLAAMRAGGNTLGMLLVTAVSNIYIGDTVLKLAPPHMIIKTAVTVMMISAVACLIGVFLMRKRNGV